MRRARRLAAGCAAAAVSAAGTPALAATDLDGYSDPRPLWSVGLSGRWGFQPNDGSATTIQVPGGGWVKQGHQNTAQATYTRRVSVPNVVAGQVVKLELGAVNHEATLSVDGRRVGTQLTSFTPQSWDVSRFVRPGGTHELKLDVKGRGALTSGPGGPNPPGYAGPTYTVPTAAEWSEAIPQGIFGPPPKLSIYPAVHISDAFVRPSVQAGALSHDVWVTNGSGRPQAVDLSGALSSWNRRGWRYPSLGGRTVRLAANSTQKVTVGPVAWGLGRDSYWWPNVPYRPGYRAELHDLELRIQDLGAAIGLPAGRCVARRRMTLRLRGPRGDRRLRSARVRVNGRRVRVKRQRGRLVAVIDPRRVRGRRFTVRIRAVTGKGRRIRITRRYRKCRAGTACLRRKRIRFRIKIRRGERILLTRVTVGARRARRYRGHRRSVVADLRRVRARSVTVRVVAFARKGRKRRRITVTRRYRDCGRGAGAGAEHRAVYRFGFREMRQVGTRYELNGVRVNMRGDSLQGANYDRINYGGGPGDAYHTYPGFLAPSSGNPGWPKAVDNYLRLNYNLVRIHQEPASPYMLDVADELGLMLVGETAIRGSQSRQDFITGRRNMVGHLRDLILRDRNHASILRWSQANEPDADGRDSVGFQQELYRTAKAHDDTRPVFVDVSSDTYEDMKYPDFSVFQHYVNEEPDPSPIGGYTDDVHPRTDRPFGRGEFVWPMSGTPQGFMWFATATEKMREKDASDIRPYALLSAWASVIPGVRRGDFLTEENTVPLYGEDNLRDPWSNHHIRRNQAGFNPVLVADRDYWEAHKHSDALGNWPTATDPKNLSAGQPTTRNLVIFNDTFAGTRVDVSWQARLSSPDGAVAAQGSLAADVPLGGRVTRPISFTTPAAPGQRLYLVLSSSKPGEGEIFRERDQYFDLTP